jgi:hypothetical protein
MQGREYERIFGLELELADHGGSIWLLQWKQILGIWLEFELAVQFFAILVVKSHSHIAFSCIHRIHLLALCKVLKGTVGDNGNDAPPP